MTEGWTCPVCGRGLSPSITVCPCDGQPRYSYSQTNTTVIPCPRCGGCGSYHTDPGTTASGYSYTMTCPDCGGKGLVP